MSKSKINQQTTNCRQQTIPTLRALLLALCLLTFTSTTTATIRYVSHTGSSSPPYTTWETAADSIQKCINISSFGDTIYVGVGTYIEKVTVDISITIIGMSMDSCIIDGANATPLGVIEFSKNAKIENFTVLGNGTSAPVGIYTFNANLLIKNCRINNVDYGISINRSTSLIENCIIVGCGIGIDYDCGPDTCHSNFSNNIIVSYNDSRGAIFFFGGYPTLENNIFISEGNSVTGAKFERQKGVVLKNNLVSGYRWQNIYINQIIGDTAYVINNNSINVSESSLSSEGAIVTGSGKRTMAKNNILMNSGNGISTYVLFDSVKSDYNLFWNVPRKTYGGAYLGDGNVNADPMFVNDIIPTNNGNYDFHLQAYSPAIDTGDPNILDKDGTRSDIGMYGGPGGEEYKYLDLAPRTPRNFSISFDSTTKILLLNWDMATESDFRNYNIYSDTVSGFIPNLLNLVAQVDTSSFFDNLSSITSSSVYYKITAVDNQDNESQPGNEIAVTITGIEPGVEILRDYILYQNYPNPFNPNTKIGYEIKHLSYVKLMVYDIKGELISVLVNKEHNAGYYEVEFSSSSIQSQESSIKGIASGIYLYRIEVIGEGNIPVYTDMKKMSLIK